MGSVERTLEQVLRGTSDANISFNELCALMSRLGFEPRTKGSHHIFRRAGIPVLINLQREGNNAKPYQVRQVRRIILEYKLAGDV